MVNGNEEIQLGDRSTASCRCRFSSFPVFGNTEEVEAQETEMAIPQLSLRKSSSKKKPLEVKKKLLMRKQPVLACNKAKKICMCDPEQYGSCDSRCNGGFMNNAFEYILKVGGVETEKDYPYKGTDHGKYELEESKIISSVSNFSVVSLDEDQIVAKLVKHGPLAVAINAAWMHTYIGGVPYPFICSKHQDHVVVLVGYGSTGYAPI